MTQRRAPSLPVQIEGVAKLPADVKARVSAGQIAYETAHGVICAYTPFSLIARDAEDALIGVLSGYTAYTEIYVDDLWVIDHARHQGVGRALLAELEIRYGDGSFVNINLVTNAFQAVPFYKKCGFDIEFVRDNPVEPSLTKIFLVKWLVPRSERRVTSRQKVKD